MHPNRPRAIRTLIEQQFAQLSSQTGPIQDERLLIRDGQYCGHRYQRDDLTAVWFLEEDQIKFYDGAGHVIAVVCPSETQLEVRPDAA